MECWGKKCVQEIPIREVKEAREQYSKENGQERKGILTGAIKKRISFQQSFSLFKSLVYGAQDITNKVYQFSNYLMQLKTSNLLMQNQCGTSWISQYFDTLSIYISLHNSVSNLWETTNNKPKQSKSKRGRVWNII